MNIERQYIKELLIEVEGIESIENEFETLKQEYEKLFYEKENLQTELRTIKRDMKNLKENVKKPAIIENSIDLFSAIKEGEIIKFITPTINKKNKIYPSNPFYVEMDNKGAVFDGELLGMWEIKKGNIYYYSVKKGSTQVSNEVMNRFYSNYDPDCQIKTRASKRPKKIKYFPAKEILHLNPIQRIDTGKFVSDKTKWIYTHDDGSKYLILEDGSEEVYL